MCKHLLFFIPKRFPGAGGMKEQDLMCIKLHGVNRIGLKKIIDFIYTAKLSLNMENLQDTLEAASFLQILPVLDFCKVFLISGVSKQTDCTLLYTVQLPSAHVKCTCTVVEKIFGHPMYL